MSKVSDIRRVLLVEPFEGGRWRSINAYAGSLREMLESAGIEVTTAAAPWFNPPSLVRATGKRWLQQETFREAAAGRFDIVHLVDQGLAQHAPRFRPHTATVVTCHDVMPFTVPGYYARHREAFIKKLFLRRSYRSLAGADRVLAVSVYSARETAAEFGLAALPVVVPNSVRSAFRAVREHNSGEDVGLNLPPLPRILSVGNDRAYKNLPALIEALAHPALAHASLVRVGPRLDRRTEAQAKALGVARRIQYVSAPGDDSLAAVYRACSVLAQPSLAEGFGIPVVEAMSCGLPVVASDGGALPEVLGEAGIIVPLSSADFPAAFAGALVAALESSESLAARGRARAAEFGGPTVLPRLLDAYRQAFTRHRGA